MLGRPSGWRRGIAALAAVLALAGAAAVQAHLMPAGQGSVRIDADSVFSVISIPVSALTGFDDDGDTLISLAELNRHRDALLRQAAQRLIFLGDGQAGERVFEDLLIPHLHDPGARAATGQLIAMQRHRWPAPIGTLSLRADIFGADSNPLAVQAVRGSQAQIVFLTPHYNAHTFFEGPLATLGRFVLIGAEHILLGLDHLLFLLTVLAAGAGWRYWAAVVTSFTLAHSLTLTLSSLGWVTVPASVAEPLIAASIVLMALDRLRQPAAGPGPGSTRLGRRAALVFGCGLLHGLGFALALQQLGGPAGRWLPLAGFNLGVEIGQLLFVAAALAVMALCARVLAPPGRARLARAVPATAAVLGSLLLARQLWPLLPAG